MTGTDLNAACTYCHSKLICITSHFKVKCDIRNSEVPWNKEDNCKLSRAGVQRNTLTIQQLIPEISEGIHIHIHPRRNLQDIWGFLILKPKVGLQIWAGGLQQAGAAPCLKALGDENPLSQRGAFSQHRAHASNAPNAWGEYNYRV